MFYSQQLLHSPLFELYWKASIGSVPTRRTKKPSQGEEGEAPLAVKITHKDAQAANAEIPWVRAQKRLKLLPSSNCACSTTFDATAQRAMQRNAFKSAVAKVQIVLKAS